MNASAAIDVIYVGTLPPHPGGSAISGFQLLSELARQGLRVRALGPVTANTLGAAKSFAEPHPDIEIHRYEVPHYELQPDRIDGADYRAAEARGIRSLLPGLLEQRRPHALFLGRETFARHLPDPTLGADVPCLLRVAGGGLSVLMAGESAAGLAERLARTQIQIVPGRHMVDALEGLGCNGVRYVRNFVDLKKFRPAPRCPDLLRRLDLDPSHVVIAHASNLKPLKRVEDFVAAAREVADVVPAARFLVIGDGQERPALERMCEELDLLGRFRFTGWVGYDQMPDLIRASDVVAMCSEREGMARVYLESQACGRILVASDIPPAREVVDHEANGLLYPLGSVSDLSRSLIRAARSPLLRSSLGARARARMLDHSLVDVAGEYALALMELAKVGKPGSGHGARPQRRAQGNGARLAEASIVVPLLRQPEGWLRRCVSSAAEQSVPTDVIVVTSDQTPESNLDLLGRMSGQSPGLRILRQTGPGFAEGLNSGIAEAATERIGFLLADDWLHPRAVERCLAHDADIVSTQLTNYAADGVTPLDIHREITMEAYLAKETDQARASYLSHFYLFRRGPLLDVGGVDPSVGESGGADDYDLIWTLLEHGATVHIVEEVLYFKRDHSGERLTLRDPETRRADVEKIFDKHGIHGPLRERLIGRHARWFGRPIHEVVWEERAAGEEPQ